jgi:hypothetical protein
MEHFRFQNAALQETLKRLYSAAGIIFEVGIDGAVLCEEAFAARAEALRAAVRSERFPGWQTFCVSEDPQDGDEGYQQAVVQYLTERAIPFELEEHNAERWLLLPEDEVIPDSIWESLFGPVATYTRTNPDCCFCGKGIEGEAFSEISVRRPAGAFRSVLYAHLDCLRGKVHPGAVHILETKD